MSNPETMADLLEELRSGEYAPLAYRLEAAWKREAIIHTDNSKVNAALLEENERLAEALADAESRVKLWTDRADELRKKCDEQYAKLKTVGDAAKLREAVSMLVDACVSFHQSIENGLDGHYEAILHYDDAVDDFLRCVNTAKAALAAPPRNCDRFATADDAKKEFNYLWNFVWKYGGGVVDERWYWGKFDSWLYAPATEQKGENDEDN